MNCHRRQKDVTVEVQGVVHGQVHVDVNVKMIVTERHWRPMAAPLPPREAM
jgi:hypothetical protein